jgi:hypothetical protein
MSIVNSNQLQTSITPANLTDCIEAIKVLNDNLEKLRTYGYGRDETSIKVLSEITTDNYVLNRLEKGTTALVKVDNSTTAKTVKLPVSTDTVAGDSYLFYDARSNATTNNITVDLNGCELDGGAINPVINTDKGLLWLVCYEQGKFFTMQLGSTAPAGTTIANVNDLSNALQGTILPSVSTFTTLNSVDQATGSFDYPLTSPTIAQVPPYLEKWSFFYELDVLRNGFTSGTQIIDYGLNRNSILNANFDRSVASPINIRGYFQIENYNNSATKYKTQYATGQINILEVISG